MRAITRTCEVERVKGIEPSSLGWEPRALPLSYTRGGVDSTGVARAQPTPAPSSFIRGTSLFVIARAVLVAAPRCKRARLVFSRANGNAARNLPARPAAARDADETRAQRLRLISRLSGLQLVVVRAADVGVRRHCAGVSHFAGPAGGIRPR